MPDRPPPPSPEAGRNLEAKGVGGGGGRDVRDECQGLDCGCVTKSMTVKEVNVCLRRNQKWFEDQHIWVCVKVNKALGVVG